jgi:hypothetical protein
MPKIKKTTTQNINPLPQTASLCSVLFSMLSMVIGVHHVWRHRRRADADDDEAVRTRTSTLPSPPPLQHIPIILLISLLQDRYLRVCTRGQQQPERGSLTLLACFLALPLASLLWAILSFTIAIGALCFSSAAGASVHMRALFPGVLGVLFVLALLTLLVFWDAWRSPPTMEPEEDFARGVSLRRKLEREGWLRYARRRMRIVRADAMDGMHVKMRKVRTVARRALNTKKTTNRSPTTMEDLEVIPTTGGIDTAEGTTGNENTANV